MIQLKYRFDHPLRPKGSCYLEAGIIILRMGEPEGEPLDSHVYRTSSTGSIIQGRIKEMAPGGPAPFCGLSNTVFQHYMFNMESRYFLHLSVQKALDFISKNFNLKNCFQGGAWTRTSLEKCVARSSDRRCRAHNAIVYYISRPPLSQNPPSAPVIIPCSNWQECFFLEVKNPHNSGGRGI